MKTLLKILVIMGVAVCVLIHLIIVINFVFFNQEPSSTLVYIGLLLYMVLFVKKENIFDYIQNTEE